MFEERFERTNAAHTFLREECELEDTGDSQPRRFAHLAEGAFVLAPDEDFIVRDPREVAEESLSEAAKARTINSNRHQSCRLAAIRHTVAMQEAKARPARVQHQVRKVMRIARLHRPRFATRGNLRDRDEELMLFRIKITDKESIVSR